ncbi:hypothetical protein WA026_019146 [Henosepilachna vigintioctopunctata]|uniref:39S ribosomal protein L28, mitochondrial n=1 Tax=Henosepilachna vigintioctopunctata TaxID=420089 RepID=A0AAW1V0L6_9CUCU
MISSSKKTLGLFTKPSIFEKGIGALLPEAYKNFYKEWKELEPQAVHYVPEEGKWKRNEITGQVTPIQNRPIPLIWPKEHNEQLWGGEGVVQGFQSRGKYKRRIPHFWVPVLRRSVVYSEILDKYISVIVTDRTINLINANYGFDHYLLKTPACDLKSLLALRLKRRILKELLNECPAYVKHSEKYECVLAEYKKYLTKYTAEDIEWYGYTFPEACKKMQVILDKQNEAIPLKHIYRSALIEKMKATSESDDTNNLEVSEKIPWLHKINPFGKKQETS